MQRTGNRKIIFNEFLDMIKRTDSIGVAYTYNEPSVSYEFLFKYSKKIKNIGLKNIIVSNGMINKEPLDKIIPFIDAAILI